MNPGTKVSFEHKGKDQIARIDSNHGTVLRVSYFDGKRYHRLEVAVKDCRAVEDVPQESD